VIPRIRTTLGWVGLAVLLFATIAGVYFILDRLADTVPGGAAPPWLLLLLPAAIVVLALGFAGILIRNIVRLVMDRKRGILGANLRTKLVFFFLVLVIPPAFLLFYGSAAVIRMSIEGLFRTPLEELTRQSRDLVDDWTDVMLGHCRKQAEELAAALAGETGAEPLPQFLAQWRERSALQVAMVGGGALPEASSEAADTEVLPEALRASTAALLREAAKLRRPAQRIDYLGDGLLLHAAVPVPVANGAGEGAQRFVAAGLYLPGRLTARLKQIDAVGEAYRQLRVERRDLVRTYLSLLALIFLASVFVATWMGFYLSRRITGPIEELARATREISSGNLDVRVRSDVGDEIGRLVGSFNAMAAQLQESREVITRSTADLRRSNRALDERRRYIETLMESLSTAVVSLDPAGAVTTANAATDRVLGVRPEIGSLAKDAFAEAGLEPLRNLIFPETPEGKAERRDLVLHAHGAPLHVSAQVTPLRGMQGEPIGTLVMVEDLTDQLRAQRAAAWREVARRIAHEIKNPLTPIQLAAQRLRKKFAEGAADLGSILPEATESIEREVGALKRMVDEFSRFARMPEMTPAPVEIGGVIGSVRSLYEAIPGIRWEVDTAWDVGQVHVDGEQLRRVLINLVDNAVTAMGGKGTIRIATRAYAGPGSLRIEVADTGPGIPPAERDNLFVPYYSTKRRGTGLGLAIAHRVVTDHRGTIRVEENQPRGARFIIEIPA